MDKFSTQEHNLEHPRKRTRFPDKSKQIPHKIRKLGSGINNALPATVDCSERKEQQKQCANRGTDEDSSSKIHLREYLGMGNHKFKSVISGGMNIGSLGCKSSVDNQIKPSCSKIFLRKTYKCNNRGQYAKKLSYHTLKEMLLKSSSEIVMVLAHANTGFENLLNSVLKPDVIILIVQVLVKACECELQINKAALLSTVCQSQFLHQVEQYVFQMPTENSVQRKSILGTFIKDLFIFFETVFNILPNTASEKLKLLLINIDVMMRGVEHHQKINLDEQRELFLKLQKQLGNILEERSQVNLKGLGGHAVAHNGTPPDNFREKNIFPTVDDIFVQKPAFIRPNLIKGAFLNVEHYLDIQFRLLREDFIAPLRQGLSTFLKNGNTMKRKRIENVRIYNKVTFENPEIVNDQIGFIVLFNSKKKLNINWEYSKRFMFGSLLLFSNDNFNTIIFGTVLKRNIEALQAGQVTVALHEDGYNQTLFRTEFVMVESEVYFEPYKHVMRALQGITEPTFPMEKYIVQVRKDISSPKYLLQNRDCFYTIEGHTFQILDEPCWPSAETLALDKSQFTAFKAALTQEFNVIQGPPGTGKTFLGLKIVKALLENSHVWRTNETPILVVCYTNHALDQFLEGILSVTDEIVRVGGQSRSEELTKYNLRQKRRVFGFSNDTFLAKKEVNQSMENLMKTVKVIQANLEELDRMNGIISLNYLVETGVVSGRLFTLLKSKAIDADDVMKEWLLAGIEDFKGYVSETTFDTLPSNIKEDVKQEEEGIWQTIHFDPITFDLETVTHRVQYEVNLKNFEETEKEILSQLDELKTLPQDRETKFKTRQITEDYDCVLVTKQYWMSSLKENHKSSQEYVNRLHLATDLWQLSFHDRWILYKDWLMLLKDKLKNQIHQLKCKYRIEAKRHNELQQFCDLEILQNSLVVGMTTTNAARLQPLLQALKAKIVVVEEAAEVLESHTIVSLTNRCEQVILIGDHQQLRPSTAVYKLAQQYHFDVSLFERMIKNGVQYYCLEKQHRMRPEIAKLIVPTIYPELRNDLSVHKYPPVLGITKSLFFVTHKMLEEEDKDSMSHKNCHEADFILALCRHLIWQGYEPGEITILTAYKGQMFYMRQKQRTCESLSNVRITVVDNYQGEENRIILLSTVRSNEIARIGFLKIENRVCVALSRAREGLYIIGNMDNLVQSSEIWPKIRDSLMEQESFGTHLTLKCQIHPDQLTSVNCAEDFRKVPEGGCLLVCGGQLQCEHQCERICHVNDREHMFMKCHKKCERTPFECSFGHTCPKRCYEDCGSCEVLLLRNLPCGHVKELKCCINYEIYCCKEEVDVVLPNCGHKVTKPCGYDISKYSCSTPCRNRLPCGHSCTLKCHVLQDPDHLQYKCKKVCSRKYTACTRNHLCQKMCFEDCGLCTHPVKKIVPSCGHPNRMKCSDDPDQVKCKLSALRVLPQCNHPIIMKCCDDPASARCEWYCKKKLSCGHLCSKKCYEVCDGCPKLVVKTIPSCSHKIKIKCCESPEQAFCKKNCKKTLPCGHMCKNECGEECTTQCRERIKCPFEPSCGHEIEIPCYLQNEKNMEAVLERCKSPCGTTLACGHACKGCCGSCMQGRIHVPCSENCDRTLICGHQCQEPCSAECPPCTRKCYYKCQHSDCSSKCGDPCTPCKEKCNWQCIHKCCTKMCHELCDRKPCYEECKKNLKCGHICIGFCGEPCPPLCRSCNEDQVKTILFGTEEDDNARFVYLVDCKHSVESSGMEKWLQQLDCEIALKTCPLCREPILRTQRFKNFVKVTLENVFQVKRKIFGEKHAIEREKRKIVDGLQSSIQDTTARACMSNSRMYYKMLEKCVSQLQSVQNRRRKYINTALIKCMKSQVQIIDDLFTAINVCILKPGIILREDVTKKVFLHLDQILEKLMDYNGKLKIQQILDFNRECKRFLSATQLKVLENAGNFSLSITNHETKVLYERAQQIIHSIDVYADTKHSEVQEILKKLYEIVGNSWVTESERKDIVKAMEFQQGHWFKCPNNHIYCIGECGGAMETGKCPDCGAAVGGSNHHLLSTNRLASEMDGASRHAYPGGMY